MKNALILAALLSCSGCSFILCGDRGIEQTWTMFHGVKCYGDVMCESKWTSPGCCQNEKIKQECK